MVVGSRRDANFQAKIRLLKLSMTPCKYARVPSISLITVTSMCSNSPGPAARMPSLGLTGCTRCRGLRQPRSRISRPQVAGAANTLPMRCAYKASARMGMCLWSMEVAICWIVAISWRVS